MQIIRAFVFDENKNVTLITLYEDLLIDIIKELQSYGETEIIGTNGATLKICGITILSKTHEPISVNPIGSLN